MISRRKLFKQAVLLAGAVYGLRASPLIDNEVTVAFGTRQLYVPVGSLIQYYKDDKIYWLIMADDAWLVADGSKFRAKNYPKLFDRIKTTYGGVGRVGRLPDLRIRTIP
jgi:hypothetical protein